MLNSGYTPNRQMFRVTAPYDPRQPDWHLY